MTSSLGGVLVALATPFSADGSVDEATLRALVDRTIDGGVHGVVACGSTGEFSALTIDERRLVVETVVGSTTTGMSSRRSSAWDSLLLSALAEGAAGVMAGTANVVPTELVAVHDAVNAGNLEQARQAWARVYALIDAIMAHPFIPAVRAGLEAVGFPIGSPRPPVAKLDPAATAHIAELAAAVRPVPAS
jgi:dihydrodipicolinate synthase/N-acetylneuraminate lyase